MHACRFRVAPRKPFPFSKGGDSDLVGAWKTFGCLLPGSACAIAKTGALAVAVRQHGSTENAFAPDAGDNAPELLSCTDHSARTPPRGSAQQSHTEDRAAMCIHGTGGAQHGRLGIETNSSQSPHSGALRARLSQRPEVRRDRFDATPERICIHIVMRTVIHVANQPGLRPSLKLLDQA